MKAKSIKGKSAEEIKTALEQSMADRFKPALAIVFLSVKQDRDAISKIADAASVAIYGATTNDEFIDEDLCKESVVMLLLDTHRSYFTILFAEFPEKNYQEVAQTLAKQALAKITNPSFLIAGSHMETDAEQLLFGFEDVVGKQVNVFGGMAGDEYAFNEQFVFTNSIADFLKVD